MLTPTLADEAPKAMEIRTLIQAVADVHPKPAFPAKRGMTAASPVMTESMTAIPLPNFGGGMGVLATKPIKAGEYVSCIPADSLLTGATARRWIYAVAVQHAFAFSRPANGRDTPTILSQLRSLHTTTSSSSSSSPLTITSVTQANNYLRTLKAALLDLSSGESIYVYLLLHRILKVGPDASAALLVDVPDCVAGAPSAREQAGERLLATWVSHLPPRYDNLLELSTRFPGDTSPKANIGSDVTQVVFSPLLAHVVLRETASWKKVKGVLEEFVSSKLLGGGESSTTMTTSPIVFADCDFLWAYNSLMSRGFAFDEEVWTMLPYLDYINYCQDLPNVGMDFCATKGRITEGGTTSSSDAGDDGDEVIEDTKPRKVAPKRGKLHAPTPNAAPVIVAPTAPPATPPFPLPSLQGEYIFRCTRDIGEGDQLFITYGVYSDCELAMWYGFHLNRILAALSTPQAPYDPYLRRTLTAYPFSTLTDACGNKTKHSMLSSAVYLFGLLGFPLGGVGPSPRETAASRTKVKRVAGSKDPRGSAANTTKPIPEVPLSVHPTTRELLYLSPAAISESDPLDASNWPPPTTPMALLTTIRKAFDTYLITAKRQHAKFRLDGKHGTFVHSASDVRITSEGVTVEFVLVVEFITSLLGLTDSATSHISQVRAIGVDAVPPAIVATAQEYILSAGARGEVSQIQQDLIDAIKLRQKRAPLIGRPYGSVPGPYVNGGVGLVVGTILDQEVRVLRHNRQVSVPSLQRIKKLHSLTPAEEMALGVSFDHITLLEDLVSRTQGGSQEWVCEHLVSTWMYDANPDSMVLDTKEGEVVA